MIVRKIVRPPFADTAQGKKGADLLLCPRINIFYLLFAEKAV